ncbi:LysE family translocator [Pseudorhizobium endolithicum]|jgi:threonine/homoserine/homoserine lactone efflux protein|nr:LysE family translocator [Pseudorhizobium endolithicum]
MAFLAAALLLNISPGPDIAFILGKALTGGARTGFLAMLGIWSGTLVHVLLATVGLSALLVASATAFALVKWAGAAYLVWLGVEALRSKGGSFITGAELPGRMSSWRTFRQGILVSSLNPKVAVFFLAFLPQFVVAGAGPVALQLAFHGILIIVVAALVEPPLVLLAGRLANWFRANNRAAIWLDRALGGLLIALGVRLALSADIRS